MRARPLLVLAFALALAAGANLVAAVGNVHSLPGRPQKAFASELPRVRFVAAPGSSILLHGTYPKFSSSCVAPVQPILHARYPGTIEIGRDTDGTLFVIGVLPFEDYLKGNDKVFASAPLPYLRPVKEHDDGASPLSHWTVTLSFGDVARFLRAAGHWGSGSITSVTKTGGDVVVKGGGTSATLAVTDFRIY